MFQVQEDEVWNDVNEVKMENLGLENDVYMYTKQRAVETIDRLLEKKINHQGYAAIHHQLYEV